MIRQVMQISLLTGALLVGLVPLAMAAQPASTGVVATVTAVDPKTDMATLTTTDGEVFQLSKYEAGNVGSQVECDRIEDGLRPRFQHCQPWN